MQHVSMSLNHLFDLFAASDGIGLKQKNIEAIMRVGFTLRLHGTVVDWSALLKDLKYRKLTPKQREKIEDKRLNAEMKAYWDKAVTHVNDGSAPHPGKLIDQSFVKERISKIHEVDDVL